MDDYDDYADMELFDLLLQHFQRVQLDFHEMRPGWNESEFKRSDLRWPTRFALGGIEYVCNLMQDMKQLQSDSNFSDVSIKVDGKVFHGHRCVLAAASQYFKTMFSSDFKESQAKEVELKGIDGDVFEVIFDFMYSGKIHLFEETAVPALHAAAYLGICNAERLFIDYFDRASDENMLYPHDILSIWDAAENHGMKDLSAAFYTKLLNNFRAVKNTEDFLEKAPSRLIADYLGRGNLYVSYGAAGYDDEQLFRCIIEWLKYDWENRKVDAYKFLQKFRLGVIPKEKVQELMDAQILEIPECKKMMDDLIEKWKEFEGVDDPMKLPESFLPRGMIKTLIAFGGRRESLFDEMDDEEYDSDESYNEKSKKKEMQLFGHYFDKRNSVWSHLLNPKLPGKSCFKLEYPSMVVVGRDIYVGGGRRDKGNYSEKLKDTNQFSKLDAGNEYKWIELPPMKYACSRFALVHHDGCLYAIGGMQGKRGRDIENYLSRVERFNLSTEKWDHIYTLPLPLAHTRAVVVDGKILVYGLKGYGDREKEFWLVGFDPESQNWSKLLQESYTVKRDAPNSILTVHDGVCYRVKYEEVRHFWETKYVPHVNRIELKPGSSDFKACIGLKVEGQDTLPDNKAGAFHIDGHIYVNVCGFAHKTGAVQGDPNSGVEDLNGWCDCQSLDNKGVVEYAYDPRKMW